jgi:hypothetical protein
VRSRGWSKATWLLLAAAAGMLWVLFNVWRESHDRGAASLLKSANWRMSGNPPDYPAAMRELDLAIRAARDQREDSVAADALEFRSKLFIERGQVAAARQDLLELLDRYRPDDVGLLIRLAFVETSLGEYDAALERCERVLALSPQTTHIEIIRGNALFSLGRAEITQARELLEERLPDAESEAGVALAERIAALDADDPLHPALQHDLTSLFPAGHATSAQQALAHALAAGSQWAAARRSWTRSLINEVHPSAAFGLLDVFFRAQRMGAVIDLGQALRTYPKAISTNALQHIAIALDTQGRTAGAVRAIEVAVADQQELPPDFLGRWCELARRAKLWQRLTMAAWRYRVAGTQTANQAVVSAADCYLGLSYAKIKDQVLGQKYLNAYTTSDQPEPFPGALAESFLALAELARGAGDASGEQLALGQALSLDHDLGGEHWLRLAELQLAASDSAALVEKSYAHALRLLPERSAELRPRWEEQGRLALLSQSRDIELLHRNLRSEGRWYPAREAGSFELYELAQLHRERGEPSGASETCDHLLRSYPRFPPALELLIEIQRSMGRTQRAVDLLLQRVELGGAGTQTVQELRELQVSELESDQVLRLMRSDPRHSGLLALAQSNYERGRGQLALAGLYQAGFEQLGDRGRLLAAHSLCELGRWTEAHALLREVAPSSAWFSEALWLRIQAGLALGQDEFVAAALDALASSTQLKSEWLLPAVTELLARKRNSDARAILFALDRNASSRTSEVVLRLAELDLCLGRVGEARESLLRLEALREDGASELGLLLAALRGRSFPECSALVQRLRESHFEPTPLQEAALLALQERPAEARAQARTGLLAHPADPAWNLLSACIARLEQSRANTPPALGDTLRTQLAALLGEPGAPAASGAGAALDPREILGVLIALESRLYPWWAFMRLDDAAFASAPLLRMWLQARVLAAAERPEFALLLLQRAIALEPRFAAAYELAEQIESQRAGEAGRDAVLALHAQRRSALGPRPGDEVEALVLEARAASSRGDHVQALELARGARDAEPQSTLARRELARALARTGANAAAAREYELLAERAAESELVALVPEFLAALARAAQAEALPAAARVAQIEALAVRLPRDPALALALAREDLAGSAASRPIGVGRAFARLERFRLLSAGEPLERLRKDSTRAWFDFHLQLDPTRAERFVREELALDPGLIELWLMLGEALEAQGRPRDALEQYEMVNSMLPDSRAVRRAATLLADFGDQHARVSELVALARRLDNLAGPDFELEFVLARSMVNTTGRPIDEGLDALAQLWERRAAGARQVPPSTLGLRYGASLLLRAAAPDRARARTVLAEVLPTLDSAHERALCEALYNAAGAPGYQ